MAQKVNPFLAKFEAELEKKYFQKMQISQEIGLIAMMIMCNDLLQVGPGRAADCLHEMLANEEAIAETIISDSEDDNEILRTKHDIASRLKNIFGDRWPEVRRWFPLLKIYWEEK